VQTSLSAGFEPFAPGHANHFANPEPIPSSGAAVLFPGNSHDLGVAVKIGQRSMVQTDEGEMARLFQAWKGFLRKRVVTMEIKRNTARWSRYRGMATPLLH
jgi:hypothetical protein